MSLRSKPWKVIIFGSPLVFVAASWALVAKRPRVIATLPTSICALAWSPDGSKLAMQDERGVFHLWSRGTGQLVALQGERKTISPAKSKPLVAHV